MKKHFLAVALIIPSPLFAQGVGVTSSADPRVTDAGMEMLKSGGSAADAQHFAAELVGRFEQERRGLAAIALSCNAATLTSIGNDYGFEHIFSRQIEAIAQPSDIFVAISTSGNSANIVAAAVAAGALGCPVIALTGSKASKLSVLAQHWLPMPSDHTARIQEAYLLVGHILCGLMEKDFVRH